MPILTTAFCGDHARGSRGMWAKFRFCRAEKIRFVGMCTHRTRRIQVIYLFWCVCHLFQRGRGCQGCTLDWQDAGLTYLLDQKVILTILLHPWAEAVTMFIFMLFMRALLRFVCSPPEPACPLRRMQVKLRFQTCHGCMSPGSSGSKAMPNLNLNSRTAPTIAHRTYRTSTRPRVAWEPGIETHRSTEIVYLHVFCVEDMRSSRHLGRYEKIEDTRYEKMRR